MTFERCSNGIACDDVVMPYINAATLHGFGQHELAEQFAATGDAVADRHGLWHQLESEVTT